MARPTNLRLIFCQDDHFHLYLVLDDGQLERPTCGAKVMLKELNIAAKSTVTMPVCPQCVQATASKLGMTLQEVADMIAAGKAHARS